MSGGLHPGLGLTLMVLVAGGSAAYLMWPFRALTIVAAAVGVAFVVVAALLLEERYQRGTAVLFGLSGACWILFAGGALRGGPLPLLGFTLGPMFVSLGGWALLRYPEPRLGRWYERCFVAAAMTWQALNLLAGTLAARRRPEPAWWPPTLGLGQDTVQLMQNVYWTGGGVLGVAYIVVVLCRVRRLRGVDRWVLAPVIVSAIATGFPVVFHLLLPLLPDPAAGMRLLIPAEAALLTTIPVALLVAVIRRRLAAAAAAGVVLRLDRPATPRGVREALREALRDPGLEVLFWVPAHETYVNSEGHRVAPPVGPGQCTVPVTTGSGDPLAMVVADPSLLRHLDLVDAALRAVGMAVENARLEAEAAARLQQVRAVQVRVLEAGISERRRLERDLHDGAQQRLIGLAMNLAATTTHIDDPVLRARIDQVRDELRAALDELREFARGIHPVVLTQDGLGPALAAVAERLPLLVDLEVPSVRFAPAVEAAAYFVACEVLANSVKHSGAARATVRIVAEADTLVVEAADDGRGGADPAAGTGLTGLADRVRSLGGELTINSPPGVGTRVIARIPCG